MPACRQRPCRTCVSHVAAPNCTSNSEMVYEISSGRPSLNRSGSNISKRHKSLIRSRPFHGELKTFGRKFGERFSRHRHFAGGPAFSRKSTHQKCNRALLGLGVGESNDRHGPKVEPLFQLGKLPCLQGTMASILEAGLEPWDLLRCGDWSEPAL